MFTVHEHRLNLLLVPRMHERYRYQWVLPGGPVQLEEDLEECARRELEEQTGICGVYLEQLYTFGRVSRDPGGRIVSVAYYALMPPDKIVLRQPAETQGAEWFSFSALPVLLFDQQEIVATAHRRLATKLDYSTLVFQLVPEKFTLGDLQEVHEIILGTDLDKRNFRRQVLALGKIEDTREMRRDGRSRPARLYRVKHPGPVDIVR